MCPHSPPIISPFSKKRNQDPNSICSPFVHPFMGISVLTSYCSCLVFFRHPLEAHSSSPAAHDPYLRQRSNLPLKFRDEDSSQRCDPLCFGYVRIQLAFLKQFVKIADSDKLILFPLFQLSSDSLPVIPPALSVSSGERDCNFQSLPAMMQQSNLLWWWLH